MSKRARVFLVAIWLIVLSIAFFAAKGIRKDMALDPPRHPEPFSSPTVRDQK